MLANQHIARFIDTLDRLDSKNCKIPGLILSHAGFGKTSTIKLYCKYKDYNLVTLIPSMFASDDILGIQSVSNGKLVRLTPSWFNNMLDLIESNHKRTVLFIDEITTCDPYIQGPLLDLIFNGNLGGEHLPDNVFIIAAGNYSSDLNSVFKMSAPLVNRFMLLNLRNVDFNLEELVNNSFESIKSPEEMESYLGLQHYDTPSYSFAKFKSWIGSGDEVEFGATDFVEDSAYGILGFTSIRSLSYSLKFAQEYFSCYHDKLWARVIGDTLGRNSKRENKPLQIFLINNLDLFENTEPVANSNLISNLLISWQKLVNSAQKVADTSSADSAVILLPESDIWQLSNYMTNLKVARLTASEADNIHFLFKSFQKFDKRLVYLYKKFKEDLANLYSGSGI